MKTKIAAFLHAVLEGLRRNGDPRLRTVHKDHNHVPSGLGRCGGCDRIWK